MSDRNHPTTIQVNPYLMARLMGLPEKAQVVNVHWSDVGAGTIDVDVVAEGWPEGLIEPELTDPPRERIWTHGGVELGRGRLWR